MTPFFRKVFAGFVVSILTLALVACSGEPSGDSSNLDGVYHSATGAPITLTLKEGKATVQVANESKTLDYKVDGKKLIIVDPKEGDVVFTINDDGTLNGELGVMSKKPL